MTYLPYAAEAGGESAHNPILPELPDLIWGSVVFIVLLIFFWRYVLPRVYVTLDERSAKIEGNIAQAETVQAEAQAALEEYTRQLADARAEAGRIREQARTDGAKIVAEARDQAQSEATRIATQAQQQIEAERQAALVSLRGEVGTLAIDLASGVVGETLSDDARAKAIVDRFLAELESADAADAAKA